jgi:dTDP-4-amino-4,6-dideoxygalactose transaminase
MIRETKPNLPDYNEFCKKIKQIFDSGILTNNGRFVQEFERRLGGIAFCNGTQALQLGIQALGLSGEVITTRFTFPATYWALIYNNIKPVFCPLDNYYNIDPNKIEGLITKETTGILPVHVFGNPCKVKQIQKIADKHNLKVIYDAAHAFGVEVNGIPIGEFGDMSIFSFHATKKFNTMEGGFIICKGLKERLRILKNFGYDGNCNLVDIGTNAKMTEMQAAFGLLLLKGWEARRQERKGLVEYYRSKLPKHLWLPDIRGVKHNYLYFVVKGSTKMCVRLVKAGIDARFRFNKEVLSLPLYNGLTKKQVDYIVENLTKESRSDKDSTNISKLRK